MLLERNDVNLDSADKSGRTPLSWAAMLEREKIVRMLSGWNCARLGIADESGRTLCSRAAKSGYKGIVSMLLDQNNANHDAIDQTSQTPFALADTPKHVEIANTLPEWNINPSIDYKNGCVTAFSGQEEWHNPNAIL